MSKFLALRVGSAVVLTAALNTQPALAAPRSNPSEVAKIRRTIDAFIAAYDHADLDGIMRFYADDFAYMVLAEPTGNKASLRLGFERAMGSFAGDLKIPTDEIVIEGNMEFDRGDLVMVLTPRAGGDPITVKRRFLNIRRRDASG